MYREDWIIRDVRFRRESVESHRYTLYVRRYKSSNDDDDKNRNGRMNESAARVESTSAVKTFIKRCETGRREENGACGRESGGKR